MSNMWNQQSDIAKDCPGIELNSQSFETAERLYLGNTIGARECALECYKTDQEWVE